MSQTLARTRGPIPNVLGQVLGDYGTLVIHAGAKWFYFTTDSFTPPEGMTSVQFIRTFHLAPPSNVNEGWWGIVPGLADDNVSLDCNWTGAEVQAALDHFVEEHAHEYKRPDGVCMDPYKKGRMLKRREMEKLIFPAPPDR